jgi:hypothetical protein
LSNIGEERENETVSVANSSSAAESASHLGLKHLTRSVGTEKLQHVKGNARGTIKAVSMEETFKTFPPDTQVEVEKKKSCNNCSKAVPPATRTNVDKSKLFIRTGTVLRSFVCKYYIYKAQ